MFTWVSLINPPMMSSILLLKPLVLARVSTRKGPTENFYNSVKPPKFTCVLLSGAYIRKHAINSLVQQTFN